MADKKPVKKLRRITIEPAKNGFSVEAHHSSSGELYSSNPERTVHESLDSALSQVKKHMGKC